MTIFPLLPFGFSLVIGQGPFSLLPSLHIAILRAFPFVGGHCWVSLQEFWTVAGGCLLWGGWAWVMCVVRATHQWQSCPSVLYLGLLLRKVPPSIAFCHLPSILRYFLPYPTPGPVFSSLWKGTNWIYNPSSSFGPSNLCSPFMTGFRGCPSR